MNCQQSQLQVAPSAFNLPTHAFLSSNLRIIPIWNSDEKPRWLILKNLHWRWSLSFTFKMNRILIQKFFIRSERLDKGVRVRMHVINGDPEDNFKSTVTNDELSFIENDGSSVIFIGQSERIWLFLRYFCKSHTTYVTLYYVIA